MGNMKFLYIIFVVIFISGSFAFSQEEQKDESSYPKFIPYVQEVNNLQANTVNIDVKQYGKEQPARWLSVDPMANKYPGWSPYNYVSNNPILRIDLQGDSDLVANMRPDLQYNVISSASQVTGIPLYITETGMLQATPSFTFNGESIQLASAYGTPTGGGSSEAANFLTYSMNNNSIVNVIGTTASGCLTLGNLIKLNGTQIESFINGTTQELNKQTLGYGIVFLHELVHSILGQSYFNSPTPLSDPTGAQGTGVVVDYINKIRAQLGPDYGQRTNYEALPSSAGFNYIPFNSTNGDSRITFWGNGY
jgi:hypothetical protein